MQRLLRHSKMVSRSRSHDSSNLQQKHMTTTENAELAVGVTGAVIAADQIKKTIESEEHKTSHAVKAAIGAAVAIGAWEMLRRADAEGKEYEFPIRRSRSRSRGRELSRSPSRSDSESRSRSRSKSKKGKHHDRQLIEEIIGAYSVGKEMLGDRRHHIAHLVGEAIGATGLIQELREKDRHDDRRK
ncbi:hypothetical protein BGZ60DRAFT_233342 [Tricladium varicosporioides]|nr:hypothetical protein BGZ60DRAFT_233342 [Hymenoscyphus varicosporioides]